MSLPHQGDLGGRKILQKKWTSFLKARLICHIPQYETLRGVCSLDADTSARTHFYAAFTLTTQWSVQGQWGGKKLGTAQGLEQRLLRIRQDPLWGGLAAEREFQACLASLGLEATLAY